MICFFLYIVLGTVCVDLLSAEPEISVSGPVGSTAVLPCELTSVGSDRSYIRWNNESGIVLERKNGEKYEAGGYEGRVDVPVEELRKGNCSLVLRNLRLTDAGDYTSYKIETKSSGRVRRYTAELSHVTLSVYEKSKEKTSTLTGDAGMENPHPLIMISSLLSCSLLLLFS